MQKGERCPYFVRARPNQYPDAVCANGWSVLEGTCTLYKGGYINTECRVEKPFPESKYLRYEAVCRLRRLIDELWKSKIPKI